MRIACLQFAPHVADVENNLNRADEVLNQADPNDLDLDLLVLPELAFTGYNFKSLTHISPYLEESSSGISSLWARNTALKHDCTVVVGYPEKVDPTLNWPTDPQYYNSAIAVNGDGETVANYRKTHLYYTDETWALEGSHGFFGGRFPGLGRTAMGICMDLNPYKFEAPWNKFEFGQHVLDSGARLVIVSMAWLTNEEPQEFLSTPLEPDSMTLLYWVSRLEPLIRVESNQEVIVVFANRCGTEDEATYAGTSAVVGIQSGEIWVYGILGRGETGLLVVDTDSEPYARLAYQPLQPTLRSENNVSSDLEASLGNDLHPISDAQDPFKESPEDLSNAALHPSTGQHEDDLRAWHMDAMSNAARRYNDQSRGYSKEHINYESNEPQAAHTPRASSPKLNIDSLHLDIPPDQYMLRRYLESESPVSRLETFKSSTQSTTAPPEAFRGSRKDQDDYVAFYPDMREDEKRFSLRSDVSVWNNQPGRVRQISVSMVAPPELSHISNQDRSRTVEVGNGVSYQDRPKSKSKAHSQRQSSDWNSRRGSEYGVPISRQSSQNQLRRKYSQSQHEEIARSYSSSAVLPPHLLQSHTASQAATEEAGRGRRRSSHKQLKDRRRPEAGRGTDRSLYWKRRPPDNDLIGATSSLRPEQERLSIEKKSNKNGRSEESASNTNSGPKTPTAMLLIPDLELPDGLEKTFSLLKCVEKAPEHIVRRRVSSIW
ncbi:nitrilase cyanide hydratase and apolipo n-acyltransferase [Trichoderma arundinaceum]|uniref:Nitrilase cyanide hydratase and apolipo n-acyltransferase n=1 Tax=Trichoderma arundinaceum TaxID=490622 RepID=A0A395N8J8_TRIAR|nr:nitrilase cyanide hydratase and apolipo n-acyltransferase [Trichoderma arundinaceum]